jgi:hypothetical protein
MLTARKDHSGVIRTFERLFEVKLNIFAVGVDVRSWA